MTLFLFLAKLAWLALRPSNLLWLAVLVGLAMLWRSRKAPRAELARLRSGSRGSGDQPSARSRSSRFGRRLLVVAGVAYLVLASPLGHMPLWLLENRFPPCRLERIDSDVVAVLGGAVKTNLSNQVGQITVGDSGERILAMAALAKAPDAPLILASGGTFALQGKRNESQWIASWLEQVGVPEGRVAFEGASLNTYQNAQQIKTLLPRSAKRVTVVTSAFHMPRAVGVFRAAGFEVQACAVDYRVNLLQVWGYPDAALALSHLDLALHEALGLLAYGLTGRSQAWLPGEGSS